MKEFFKNVQRKIIISMVYAYCKIVYRLKIVGLENIPKDGPLLFCGNHRTYLDPPLIMITAKRKMSFMAKEELQSNFIIRTMCNFYNVIWVKREHKDISSLKEALKVLKNGGCVGIFPEGTRNGMEKNDGKMKNGAAYMAIRTGTKIIPIGIQGKAKPFTKNTIIYGEPLDFSKYAEVKKLDKSVEEEATEELKNSIIKLAESK